MQWFINAELIDLTWTWRRFAILIGLIILCGVSAAFLDHVILERLGSVPEFMAALLAGGGGVLAATALLRHWRKTELQARSM